MEMESAAGKRERDPLDGIFIALEHQQALRVILAAFSILHFAEHLALLALSVQP